MESWSRQSLQPSIRSLFSPHAAWRLPVASKSQRHEMSEVQDPEKEYEDRRQR